MGYVRVGVSLPSRAGQMLLQPLKGSLELPPRAFITGWALFGIVYVCLYFGITPEGLSLHLARQRAKNEKQAPEFAGWVPQGCLTLRCKSCWWTRRGLRLHNVFC